MLGILGIALAIYLLTRSGDQSTVIQSGDVTTTTSTRTGSNEPTDKNFDYATTADEADNNPWTWANAPAIFKQVPLSPGSRGRWLRLAQLWRELKEVQFDIYAMIRSAEQTAQERGGRTGDYPTVEIKKTQAKERAIFNEIKRIAAIQKQAEDRYKAFLVNTFGTAQTNAYYAERKQEIAAGIWPAADTVIVPVTEKKNLDPSAQIPDAGPETITAIPMGASPVAKHYNREQNVYTIDHKFNREKYRQTGSSKFLVDAKRTALPPGKRVSAAGNVYYERRRNRSDKQKSGL